MSADIKGGLDYALLKRHYDANDFTSVNFAILAPFGILADYYVVGLNAYAADPTVVPLTEPLKGWTLFKHGQGNYPAWTQVVATGLGISLPPCPPEFPAFEAKETVLWSTADMYVRFDSPNRVPHIIAATLPPRTPFVIHERFFMIFFAPVTPGAGILNMSFFG